MTQSTTEPPASAAPTSLPEWLTYIETMHPAEMELGLERLQSVADKGRWNSFEQPVVTFAGTNGKGSTLAALEALLLAHGLNVAAYTSPHLIRYNERVRINGKPVSDEALVAAFNRVESVRENTPLTYFEMGTLAALALFKEGPCDLSQGSEPFELDVILLEVGLGGRLDAVNCVDPDLAVITTIDIDHTEWLGDSIEAIAREKAGIMRRGQAVVFADAAAPEALYQQASALECSVIDRTQYGILDATTEAYKANWSDHCWSWFGVSALDQERVTIELQGLPVPNMPLISAATAIQLLYRLFEMTPVGLRRVVERDRLVSALRQVELKGRMTFYPSAHTAQAVPLLLDIAHNRQSVAYLAERLRQWRSGAVDRQLGEYQGGTVVALFGALQDKQVLTMVETIRDAIDLWVPAEAVGPRALKAEALTALLMGADLKVMDMMDNTDTLLLKKGGIQRLLSQSLTKLGENDANMRSIELLVIFGSFYLVGPLLSQLESEL